MLKVVVVEDEELVRKGIVHGGRFRTLRGRNR